ncbi:3-oxoadipate enol-lactonase [Devosia sp. ZB163]|uniref:3-oxoadipate enol-lactonase n=1 Tax=Devosia sp. ZB163 TaxID=3025938 RepID=UPI00235EFB53|nr:3-oxoadipate enol-lactonase [Devosia sp. ZB163]MDC9826204.1 3-oxoadipate enol-lactonase [Devosia sp. ZB163]
MAFAASSFGLVHYRDTGPRDAPALVFVNSLGTDLCIWDGVVEQLATDHRAITYDKRGHGLSSVPPAPYAIADLSRDLLELVDHLGLDHFVLAGVSVGGMVAMRFAIDHPERLASVVLCDTAARIGDLATWNARIDAIRRGGMAAIADAVLLRWFPHSIRTGRDVEMAGWRNLLLRSSVEGYAGTCAALRDADLTAAVADIAVPTLMVVGAEDQSTPPDLVRATADRIPGARFELIAGAGHIPSIDRPTDLARLIRRHVEEAAHG